MHLSQLVQQRPAIEQNLVMSSFAGKNDEQTEAIIAAAIEVHKQLGHGFLEKAYSKALAFELLSRSVPTRTEIPIPIYYKQQKSGCGYQADMVCFDEIIVELKAQSGLGDCDLAQVINYLKASGYSRALLINFGQPKIQIRRLIVTTPPSHAGIDYDEAEQLEEATARRD